MEARRRWATAVVAIVAIAAGGGGGVYLWREAFPADTDAALQDGGPAGDASARARVVRNKSKSAKKRGKPRAGPKPSRGVSENSDILSDDEVDEGDEAPFEPPFRGRGPAGPTYEAAIASNKQEIAMGGKPEPDLTDAQLAGPMHNGAFVSECGAPDRMKVTVKVAVKMGRPAGVSVTTRPPDPDIAGCIDRYVRTFSWPSSTKMDSFTSTY